MYLNFQMICDFYLCEVLMKLHSHGKDEASMNGMNLEHLQSVPIDSAHSGGAMSFQDEFTPLRVDNVSLTS